MHNDKKYLIIVAGPTAVGKSQLALQLAQDLACEILSADSRQIYRKLDIGTAKASSIDRGLARHHFIDILDIEERYTASQFEVDGLQLLEKKFKDHNLAIVCGGTGLYLRALMEGLDEIPDVPLAVQNYFDSLFEMRGIKALQDELRQRDRAYYQNVDHQNARRLIRALSVIEHTGKSMTSYHSSKPRERPFKMIPILLTQARDELYQKIDRRVDEMVSQGLEDEALQFKKQAHLAALQTVGYQEWFPYFVGDYDRSEAIRLIKRNTRRYAKRQMTWFNKYGNWKRFTSNNQKEIRSHIDMLLQ